MSGAAASQDPQAGDAARLLPDLTDALNHGQPSFSQLCAAWLGRHPSSGGTTEYLAAYSYLYPALLRSFQLSHGTVVDFLPLPTINAYAARTDALSPVTSHGRKQSAIAGRAGKSDMHLLYDLSKAHFGGDLLTRIEMMSADASRLLSGQKLQDCLDQLFSTTGDLLGLLVNFPSVGDPAAQPPAQLAIIEHDLRVIQQKYLITTARLTYFQGALTGTVATASLAVLVLLVQTVSNHVIHVSFDLGLSFYLAWLFGTAGATLSVVQRISGGGLDLRYDVGTGYTFMLGLLRPWIGAFGGLLFWVLVQGGVILNPNISPYYLAALAFGFGIAERTLGDVASKTGIAAIPASSTTAPSVPPSGATPSTALPSVSAAKGSSRTSRRAPRVSKPGTPK